MTTLSDQELLANAGRIKGKVVLITGAANGIGRETALLFAKFGAKLVIGDINEAGANEVAEEIKKNGGAVKAQKCDVTSWDDQVLLFDSAVSAFGSVDVVVPNAGIAEAGNFLQLRFENGRPQPPDLKTIDVNLTSVMYTTNLALHYLVDGKRAEKDALKAIVLIGSMSSWMYIGVAVAYTTAKHAILGLMRALGPVCTAKGIRVGSIHPWFADTAIITRAQPLLEGLPLTPVHRIAATIVCVATDPDPKTSPCPWLLLDQGDVLRLENAEITEGSYKIFNARIKALLSA